MVTFGTTFLLGVLFIPWAATMLAYAALTAYQTRRQPLAPWLFPASAAIISVIPLIAQGLTSDRLLMVLVDFLFLWAALMLFRRYFTRRDMTKRKTEGQP